MKYKILTITTTIVLFFCTLTGYTQNFWEPLGAPAGVEISSLATTADGTIYIGTFYNTDDKGVYCLSPGSSNWKFSGLLENSPYSLEIAPTGEIFAGCTGKIFKSIDNGNSWYPVCNCVGNWTVIKAFGNGLVFAGNAMGSTTNSILRSLDNGESWDTVFQTSSNCEPVYDFVRAPDGTIYMGTTHYFNGGGVYRSSDNGTTWEYIGLPNEQIMSVVVNAAGEVFAGGYTNGIFKYDGYGASWTLLKNEICVAKMAINSQGIIFAACNWDTHIYPGGVLRSGDNGQTFDFINSGLGINTADGLDLDASGYLYTYGNYTTTSAGVFKSNQSTNIFYTILDGTITYANADSTFLSNVHVKLMQNDSIIRDTITNAEGYYQLKNFPYGSYTMECSSTKPWGGVTASDVLLYRKHIAHIINLNGISLASGDVNGSGDVTAVDVLLIRKRIAHLIDAFPAGDWLFNNQPVMISTSHMTYNFSGICYGDANGSYVPPAGKK